MEPVPVAIAMLIAYLAGSIPSGYLAARLTSKLDPLQLGSSRTGATNVLRLLGWKLAAIVLLADLGKAVVAIAAARFICGGDPMPDLLAGLAAMAGHNYSIFLGMKGGRGVAVGAAVTVVMAPVTLLVGTAVFATTVTLTRYVSLGSMAAALSMPPVLLLLVSTGGQPPQHLLFAILSAAFVVYSHRDSIGRLRYGTERRLRRRVRAEGENGGKTD